MAKVSVVGTYGFVGDFAERVGVVSAGGQIQWDTSM